jgi:serine/threonine protein kinase
MIGKTIGKYRVVDKLGRGGMGTVYKAVDETLDREVAIKVLNPDLTDSEIMKRFRTEATTLAKLNHPEIATIHEIHRSDSDLLMVMELVRGETLDQLSLRCGPLPPERAAYLVAQVLGALEHAHRAGVVHRDLKPANVMVTELGGIKVMDFGIARVVGAEHLTSDGHMMGTPAYMAPEQVMAKDVDGRADVYSCGVVFYRLLTGNLPFQADTAIGMVQKQLSDPPTPLHAHRADVPAWCQSVLDRALAKSPADRYQTAEEFRRALLAAIGTSATEHTGLYAAAHAVASTPPPGPLTSTGGVGTALPVRSAPPTPAPASSAQASRPAASPRPIGPSDGATIVLKRNHFAMAGALLALLAVGVAVLAVVAIRRTSPPPASAGAPVQSLQVAPGPANATPPTSAPAEASTDVPSEPPATSPATATTAPPAATSDGVKLVAPPVVAPGAAKPADPSPPTSGAARPASTTAAATPAPARRSEATAAASGPHSRTADAPAPAAKTGAAEPARGGNDAVTPFVFDAKAVVVDGGKNREHDAKVLLSDGRVTVTEKNNRVVTVVPYGAVLALSNSNSKQPLWNSPSGPAEVVKVEGGAFGFLKGGRNWVVLLTKDASVVLRVNDDEVGRVIAAIEDRTGRKAERIAERKD